MLDALYRFILLDSLTVCWRGNLLSEGAEGVAEGLCSQMEQSLQEHVDLQRVETLTLIYRTKEMRYQSSHSPLMVQILSQTVK